MNASLRAAVVAEWRGLPANKTRPDRWQAPGDLLPKLMQQLGLSERLRESEVIDAWKQIVGEFIAAHSAPVSLRAGVLSVRVLQPALHYQFEQISKAEILRKLKLGDACYQVTRELPYGRQRLLEIALALATRPKVLLLDEPAAGVPQEESGEVFEAVAGLSDDLTLLFIEHDMHVVFRFASHIIVLVGGAIFTEGTPAEIAADPGVREVYLGKRKHG